MTTVLKLGVNDIPYSGAYMPRAKKIRAGQRKFNKGYAANMTTGDVAEILEAKYAVMQTFFTKREGQIAKALEDSVTNFLEAQLSGAPSNLDVFGPATQDIHEMFDTFITMKEMDGAPGVPTNASLLGVSHRFKDRRGAPGRPSFVDTGLYSSSFKAWMEE